MKSLILKTCILSALSSAVLHAENLIVNGDFETGEGNAFYATPPWYNWGAGLNQGASARSSEGGVIEGSYSAIVNDRYVTEDEKYGSTAHIQKTSHIIQEGDSFNLTYQWRPGDDYWQRSADTIRFVIFATENDKMSGPVVWSSPLTSDFFKGNKITAPLTVTATTSVVNSEAVGKVLFVIFYGVDTINGGTDDTPHWARVDSIEVEVVNAK